MNTAREIYGACKGFFSRRGAWRGIAIAALLAAVAGGGYGCYTHYMTPDGWYAQACGYADENPAKAAKLYRKAADRGHVQAQCELARMYETGKGVMKDRNRAVKWYRKAAEQGNARAQCRLGRLYESGAGVKKDRGKAAGWYRKAAAQGHAQAQYRLGRLYETGNGVPKDKGKAAGWFRKAAEQGDAQAQCGLGRLYESGAGVKKDRGKAEEWYRRAVAQGNADAQRRLDRMRESRAGVALDRGRAEEWCRRAAEWCRRAVAQDNAAIATGVFLQNTGGLLVDGCGYGEGDTANGNRLRLAGAGAAAGIADEPGGADGISPDEAIVAEYGGEAAPSDNSAGFYGSGFETTGPDGFGQLNFHMVDGLTATIRTSHARSQGTVPPPCDAGLPSCAQMPRWIEPAFPQKPAPAIVPDSPPYTVHVNVAAQTVTLRNSKGRDILTVPCSTGAAGTGCKYGSGQTPTGRFVICAAYGEDAPLSTLFKNCVPAGTWEPGCEVEDAILARVLCLKGLERHNANTRKRNIYIHGTADTASLGSPVSHGCIRMDPADIALMFPFCPVGTKVFIE